MTLNYEMIGIRIRAKRVSQGLTQESLAERSNISPQHVSHIENSGTKLSLPCLVSICNALNTTPNEILLDSVEHCTPQMTAEVAGVFSGCTHNEMLLMLSQAKEVKNFLAIRKLQLCKKE